MNYFLAVSIIATSVLVGHISYLSLVEPKQELSVKSYFFWGAILFVGTFAQFLLVLLGGGFTVWFVYWMIIYWVAEFTVATPCSLSSFFSMGAFLATAFAIYCFLNFLYREIDGYTFCCRLLPMSVLIFCPGRDMIRSKE